MPTYEYRCTKCKQHFDAFQKMSAKPLKKCVYCGGKPERLISAGAGIIFKGSGFYETDYKRSSPSSKKDSSSAPCKNASTCSAAKSCAKA